jgi:hypothetical protein
MQWCGGGIFAGAAVPGVGARVIESEARVPGTCGKAVLFGAEFCHRAGEVLDPLQKCGAVEGVPTLASAGWGATLEIESAQWAVEFKLPSG